MDCACKTKCGDVREEDDAPGAICKGLPGRESEKLQAVVAVLIDRAQKGS